MDDHFRRYLLFPGGVAADAPQEVLQVAFADPDLPTQAAGYRFLVIGSTRVGADVGQAQARRLVADLDRRFDAGRDANVPLVAADLLRLGGLDDEAGVRLQEAYERFSAAGDALGIAGCHLLVADAALTPWSSPELSGFDPWALDREPAPVDREPAARACDDAESWYREAGSAAGLGSVAIRRAYLAAETRGDAVEAAETARELAADEAQRHLASVQLLLARVSDGRAGELRTRLPGAVARWASAGGSPSYARALVKILRGSARLRLRRGRPEQARLLVTAATDLATALGDPAERTGCLEDTAELYAALGSRGPAIGTLHEAYDDYLPHAAGSVEAWMQAAAALTALTAQYSAERHPAGQGWCAAQATALLGDGPETPEADLGEDLFAVARRRYDALPEQGRRRLAADGRPAGAEFAADMATSVTHSLRDTVSHAGVLVPVALGLQQRRDGLDALADASFAAAIAAATALGSRGVSLHVVALIAARRHAEAVALVRELPHDFPDDLRRDLTIAARDHPAAALLPRDEPSGWRDAVDDAEIALRTGDIGRARTVTATARARYERWFAALDRDPFRLSVTDDVTARWLYLLAAEAALRGGDPAGALLLADRLRALPILALLADPDPAHLEWRQATARWSTAYDLLAWSGLALDTDRSSDPVFALLDGSGVRELLDDAQLALESAESRIPRPSTPLPNLPDPAELRHHLPEGALLVQYLLAGDRLLIGVLDADVVDGTVVEVDADRVAGHITRVHATCTRTAWPGDAEASRHELARVLLEPIAAHLRRHGRIVLVPSGTMNLLPFTVLPFDGGLLGDQHVLSVLPSTALLGRMPQPRPGTTVVVGDPAFADLRRLPGTRTEALVVARHHGVDAVVDGGASSATLRRLLPEARLVHLATHGLVSEIAPTATSLALAEQDRLTVADLAGLRFDADLVVLSACDTGRGDMTVGGDVVGLGRQLIAAGAAAVVVSLWPVNDEVACVVMDELHTRLAGGTDPATALAEAQAAVRERTPRQRSERYAELARSVGVDPGSRTGLRSPRPPAPATDGRGLLRDARDWAAFVLVGRP